MDHRNALPTGYRLGEYRMEGLLGHGGFGLTYKAVDETLGKQVAIKEYLPNELAVREGDTTVHAKTSGDDDDFEWGLDRFLDEARILARFNHPSIVSVLRFFQANNTAYMVMPMVEGETLSSLIKREGKLDETQVRSFLMPLLEGLQHVHKADFLHRDIKPANIMVNEYNQPVLLDFGSARQAMGGHSRSITSVITPGYAPIEQYDSKGKQGPWTDIYALAAVCYVALTGQRPTDSPGRMRNDPTVPIAELAKGQASSTFLKAIDQGLLVEEEKRPQTISDWQDMLEGHIEIPEETVKQEMAPVVEDVQTTEALAQPSKFNKIALVATLVLVLGGGLYVFDEMAEEQKTEQARVEESARQAEEDRLAQVARDKKVEEDRLVQIARDKQAEKDRLAQIEKDKKLAIKKKQENIRKEFDRTLVTIEPGSFRMGDLNDVGAPDEKPVHQVTIDYRFGVGKFEVQYYQWQDVMQEPEEYKIDEYGNKYAITHVSNDVKDGKTWNEVQVFLQKLNEMAGLTGKNRYRLLSESEWEYVARAGTTTQFFWGNEIAKKAICKGCGYGYSEAAAAVYAKERSNDFGVHDMHGNVWEYVADCLNDNYNNAPSDGSPNLNGTCQKAVIRGGSWADESEYARSANRGYIDKYRFYEDGEVPPTAIGFRIARTF